MPLRPALATIHPRGPAPREVRYVTCPHCGSAFDISRKAMSVRCPQCTQYLQFEDMLLRQRMEGELATMGHVALSPPSEMIGRLICGQFTNEGRFEGIAIVYGNIALHGDSLTTGQLTGRSIHITAGATFRGKIRITPNPKAAGKGKRISLGHSLRPISRKLGNTNRTGLNPSIMQLKS